ncbi:MAG: GGDEF domain-containing protein [Planctomycetota bacterium]|nr:GGDEF domain-containing protein [Planctomycetota bacterium]
MSPFPQAPDPAPAHAPTGPPAPQGVELRSPRPAGDPVELRRGVHVLVGDHRGAGMVERARTLSEAGFEVEVSASLRRTLERVSSRGATVLVVDPLADAGAAEFAALAQALALQPGGALLVIVPDEAPERELEVLAHRELTFPLDFVHRNAGDAELALRVHLLEQRARAAAEIVDLRHRATHDDRTDLLRPQAFEDQFRQAFSAAQRHRLDLGLLLIDLDDFGKVNKLYDHTVGDEVIARVGATIRRALRTEDVAARLGGDEFCVLLPYTRKVDAARVVQRLLEQIPETTQQIPCNPPLRVTASLGFETFDGRDLASAEELRQHAEDALRAAKRSGGDRGIYYRSLDASVRPPTRSAD